MTSTDKKSSAVRYRFRDLEGQKAGDEEEVGAGLDAANESPDRASELGEEPRDRGGGELPALDGGTREGAAEPAITDGQAQAVEASPPEPPVEEAGEAQAPKGADEPVAAEAQALEDADQPVPEAQAPTGADEPGAESKAQKGADEPGAAEVQAPESVEEPAAEAQTPEGIEEPAASAVPEPDPASLHRAEKPRGQHGRRPRSKVGRFLRRAAITTGSAALVALVWYFASSAVVFSRPAPVDGQQPAGAEQLDDRVILRMTHVPAATHRVSGANAPINQALGVNQPAGAAHAPSGGPLAGSSPSPKSSPIPMPTSTRPGH